MPDGDVDAVYARLKTWYGKAIKNPKRAEFAAEKQLYHTVVADAHITDAVLANDMDMVELKQESRRKSSKKKGAKKEQKGKKK